MSLAATYRFVAHNTTGVAIADGDITLTARRWRWTNGAKEFEANEATLYQMDEAGGLADGAFDQGDPIDNAADAFEGGDFLASATVGGTPNGDLILYYQISTDGGLTWPDDGAGVPIARFHFSAAGTQVKQSGV